MFNYAFVDCAFAALLSKIKGKGIFLGVVLGTNSP